MRVRTVLELLFAAGIAALVGCQAQEPASANNDAKQEWENPRTPQDLDRLSNRLMTSQTDR